MHLYKAEWLSHKGEAVLSVHVHPDATRVATGGNDTVVRVWALKQLEDEDEEEREGAPRLLATLTSHYGGVNCVRWSPDGQMLATCGDDKAVFIWTLQAGTSIQFDKENIESWTVVRALKGHTGDVTGLCWSPDGTWLASCSADRSVIVWNSRRTSGGFGRALRSLNSHTEIVKGIAFDPLGTFLVSQDNREVVMWRTSDWQVDRRVDRFFDSSTAASFFYRPSWSPDAMTLAVPHAMSGTQHAALAVARGTGNFELAFLGHREPTTVTCFNPQLFQHAALAEGRPYALVAVAGQDGTVSVWLTVSTRPLVVLVGHFNSNAVTDLAWSPDGLKLLVSSQDGTVLYAEFDETELGTRISAEERRRVLTASAGAAGVSGSAATLLADPEMAHMRQQGEMLRAELAPTVLSPLRVGAAASAAAGVGSARAPPIDIRATQTVTKLPDGRVRITPVYLGNLQGALVPVPMADLDAVESDHEIPPSAPESPRPTRGPSPVPAARSRRSRSVSNAPSAPGGSSAAAPAATATAAAAPKPRKGASKQQLQPLQLQQPAASASSQQAVVAVADDSIVSLPGLEAARKPRSKRRKNNDSDTGFASLFEAAPTRVVRITIADVARVAQWLPQGLGTSCTLALEAQGDSLRLLLGMHSLWEVSTLGGASVTALVADEQYACVALMAADGASSLLVYHLLSGALVCPRLALPCAPAGLVLSACAPSHVLFVGTDAEVRVWNLYSRTLVLRTTANELSGSAELMRCELVGPMHVPVLFFFNGTAYAHDAGLGSWVCVHDAARFWNSDFQSTFTGTHAAQLLFGSNGALLAQLQAAASGASVHGLALGASPFGGGGGGGGGGGAGGGDETLEHLEHQYMAAWLLHTPAEFAFWVQTYCTQLVERLGSSLAFEDRNGPRPPELLRLYHLCDWLLAQGEGETADAKRAVLRDKVLPIVVTVASLQPMVARYRQMLE